MRRCCCRVEKRFSIKLKSGLFLNGKYLDVVHILFYTLIKSGLLGMDGVMGKCRTLTRRPLFGVPCETKSSELTYFTPFFFVN